MACFIDFATASKSLDRDATDTDSCCRHRYAAEESKSVGEFIAIYLRAPFSHASNFLQELSIFPCWIGLTVKRLPLTVGCSL